MIFRASLERRIGRIHYRPRIIVRRQRQLPG
jgi:hypothetical protein